MSVAVFTSQNHIPVGWIIRVSDFNYVVMLKAINKELMAIIGPYTKSIHISEAD